MILLQSLKNLSAIIEENINEKKNKEIKLSLDKNLIIGKKNENISRK